MPETLFDDRLRAASEELKRTLGEGVTPAKAFTTNPLDVNLLGSGASLRNIGQALRALRTAVEVPSEAVTQAGAKATGTETWRGLPEVNVPGVDLPRLNADDPEVAKVLHSVYGKNLEHWGESPAEAVKTPDGQQRMLALQQLIEADDAYAPRVKYWEEHIPDDVARWDTIRSEYKQSRKKDVVGAPRTNLGWAATTAAEQMGFGALMEAPAIGKALAAGAPKADVLKAVAAEGTPFGFARDLMRVGLGAGTVAANFAGALPKTTGALIGGAVGSAENPEHPVLGFLGGTAAGIGAGHLAGKLGEKLAGTIFDRAASSLGSKIASSAGWVGGKLGAEVPKEFFDATATTSSRLLSAVAQNPARWEALLGVGQYPGISMAGTALGSGLVGLMDETDPLEKGLLNAALGLALPVTAKYLTKIPFPGLSRFGTTLAAPAGGAIAGVVGGAGARAAKNAIFGPPEEPPDDTLLGRAFKDALIGSGVATSASVLRGAKGASMPTSVLLYDSGGDLNPLGDFLHHVLPLDVTRNMRNPTTGQHLMGDSVGMLQDANESVMARIHERFSEIAEAVRSSNISQKKLWDEGFQQQLFTAMRKSGAGGMVKPGDVSLVMKLDDDALALAGPMRKMFDDLFLAKIERGDLTWDDYLHGYVPKMIDQNAFRAEFKGYQRLLETRVVHNLQRKGVFSVPIPDDVHDPKELYRRVREGSIQTEMPALKESFTEQDASDLMRVQTVADRMNIGRKSAVEILRRGQSLVDEPVSILKEMRKIISGGEGEIPGEPFDPSLERRRRTRIPYERNPMKVLLRSIVKDARREFYGPLTTPLKNAEGKIIQESPLQEAINKIGPEFPQHQKLVADIAKSVMGYPSSMDEVVERLGERWFSNPETAPTSIRIIKDLTYAGALGMKPATGIRNLFSYMLTGSALGKEDSIQGFAQAQKNWDFWKNEAVNNRSLSNEVLDELDFARDIPSGNLGKITQVSRTYAEAMLGIQRFTEEKFRTWTNTAAMLKVLRERSAFNPGYLRDLDAARAREMLAKASSEEEWWNAARYIGKKTTDLVAWKYGPGGTGPALQGPTEKLFTMFSSWPLNYASLLQHWAASGRTQHILNMGVAAAILDKAAIEQFGYTRLTGLSGQGESREQDVFVGLPSGPFDWAMAPVPRLLMGVGQAAGGVAMQDEALGREGGAQIKRNLSTIFGLGAVPRAWQGMKNAEEDRKREAYIRLLFGGTPQREGDAE